MSFLNYAFALFCEFRQGIAQCADTKMREQMSQALEAAARVGSGNRGCDNLVDALQHAVELKEANGPQAPYQWRNNDLQAYQCFGFHQQIAFEAVGGRHSTVWQHGNVLSAPAAVHFLEEIDRYVGILQDRFSKIEQRWSLLHRVGMRLYDNNTHLSAMEWSTLGALLSNIGRTVFDSQPYMWLSGSGLDPRFGHSRLCLGREITALGVARRLESIGARMLKGDANIATFKEAMELLCVLGTFYARAFAMIPGAKTWISRVAMRRWSELRLLDSAKELSRITEVRTGSEYLRGDLAKRRFPFVASYHQRIGDTVLYP